MRDKQRILILGGLGFIGRNLFHNLTSYDIYDVTIITDRIGKDHDMFLTPAIRRKIIVGSILDKTFIKETLANYDVIFSLAGSSGAIDSIKNPYHDLDTNLQGHLNILEACKKNNRKALLIFPSTRLVYGKPEATLVNERHPIRPESIYAIHKLTTEHYYLLYQRLYGINCVIFRISNPFGPYQGFGRNQYGILNLFIQRAIRKGEIEIYGDGGQKRDFIYIEDLSDLFRISMGNSKMLGKIYNVGYGTGISLKEAAEAIRKYIPDLKIIYKDWPEIDRMIETGDYVSDIQMIKQEAGWSPMVSFEEGIKRTIAFYQHESE